MKQKGFTLIELLVVIAIIAILAAILFPVFAQAKASAKLTQIMSHAKQIGISMKMYNGEFDDRNVHAWWDWHIPLHPFLKSWDIFLDSTSAANKVTMLTYTAADNCHMWDNLTGSDAGTLLVGTFPYNTRSPQSDFARGCNKPFAGIYGHFTKNEELLGNYGTTSTYQYSSGLAESMMDEQSNLIYIVETRALGETNPRFPAATSDGAPYLEPYGTTWNEIFSMLSSRHKEGQAVIYGDTHAKYRKYSWLVSDEGKKSLLPGLANLADNAPFP